MSFLLAFLGSFVALLVALALVYTYLHLRLAKRFVQWFEREGSKAVAVQAAADNDPAGMVNMMRNAAREQAWCMICERPMGEPQPGDPYAVLVHTCEVHGRCTGCPWVLEHMESIASIPGFELNDMERGELEILRTMWGDKLRAEARR